MGFTQQVNAESQKKQKNKTKKPVRNYQIVSVIKLSRTCEIIKYMSYTN